MVLVCLLFVLCALGALVICFIKYRYTYWTRNGVKTYLRPSLPWGNLEGVGRKWHSSILFKRYYDSFKGQTPFMGIYFIIRPLALIFDLDLIKAILVKDFHHFEDHGVYYNERDDPMSATLFSLEGDKWRFLRGKLTPTFSSGKMKLMCPIVAELGDKLVARLRAHPDEEVDCKDLFARYTTDIIGNCAFGIDCNTLCDQNELFITMTKRIFNTPRRRIFYRLFVTTFPKASRFFRLKSLDPTVAAYFYNLIVDTVRSREQSNINRDDFLNLVIQMKNRSELTLDQVTAQVFLFQAAGYETSSTTMTYCAYELAVNPEIQEKARAEIISILERHHGTLDYESIQEMTYLEQVINEALRKYPPASNILRIVTKDYHPVENMKTVFKRGDLVMIPVMAVHHDSALYPDPDRFDPERFTTDLVRARHPMAFLPFGQGPRNCIGVKFAMMEIKAGLAKVLSQFRIEATAGLDRPLRIDPKLMILTAEGEIKLKFRALHSIG